MHASPRICRAIVENLLGRPALTERQRKREQNILAAGEKLLARFGRHGLTARILASALRISPATLAWHYTDLDALLGEILRRHLHTLFTALAAVPHDTPNREPALRQAYLAATRNAQGGITDAHLLLTRDRHLLPEDELQPLEVSLHSLANQLAGERGEEAMDLLDRPWMDSARAEPILAALAETRQRPVSAIKAAANLTVTPSPTDPAKPARPQTAAPPNFNMAPQKPALWLRQAGLAHAEPAPPDAAWTHPPPRLRQPSAAHAL